MKTNDGMNTVTLENSPRTTEPPAVGVPPLATGSVTYALFKHMADEHGLTLLESELTEIVRVVNDTLEERLRWWIANAEGIAQERVGSRELVSILSEWERIAFGRESVFLERFCHNSWQLAKVSWSSETMHVVYIADSGQHIADSFPLRDWLEFYEANTELRDAHTNT